MKTIRYSGNEERAILVGLVVSSEVLGKVVAGLKSETKPFANKWANQIYGWCRQFYLKYGKAPKGHIQHLFAAWAGQERDKEAVGIVESFLVTLSEDYRAQAKEVNVDFLVDAASRHFNQTRYTKLKDQLEQSLEGQDIVAVQEALATFHPISFAMSSVVNVFTDEEVWREVLVQKDEDVLIQYPGALGEFFGSQLRRDAFVAYLAPEKRGKTWWLIDVAWRAAVREKRNTFLFSVGDMSRRQLLQRLGTRAIRRPIGVEIVQIPTKIYRLKRQGEEKPKETVDTEEREYAKPVSQAVWMDAQDEIYKLTASNSSRLKLVSTSNSTTTVDDMRGHLDEAIKEGWVPDVVVVDYADILAPESGSKGQDFRHQTNETWKALRRLSQDYHCLVVTATQSDAASYDDRVIITRKNFSEDKRKLSHVTGMIGLNQTEEQKKLGIYRLNWVALRESPYLESKCVLVAGCLAIANPAMRSMW